MNETTVPIRANCWAEWTCKCLGTWANYLVQKYLFIVYIGKIHLSPLLQISYSYFGRYTMERGIDDLVRKLDKFFLESGDHNCLTSEPHLINLLDGRTWLTSLWRQSQERLFQWIWCIPDKRNKWSGCCPAHDYLPTWDNPAESKPRFLRADRETIISQPENILTSIKEI